MKDLLKKILQGFARFSAISGAIVPVLALTLGLAGAILPIRSHLPAAKTAREPLAPEIAQIDLVLAERAPELGLALRRRVATAIIQESRAAGLDPLLILGLIETESEFNGVAVSLSGARGLMQMRPVTVGYLADLEGMKVSTDEIYRDPALQVRLATRYLDRLHKRFKSLDLALMAYNAGPEKLRQQLAAGDIERFRNYPRTVRRHYARFRNSVRLDQETALAQAERVTGFAQGSSPSAP